MPMLKELEVKKKLTSLTYIWFAQQISNHTTISDQNELPYPPVTFFFSSK